MRRLNGVIHISIWWEYLCDFTYISGQLMISCRSLNVSLVTVYAWACMHEYKYIQEAWNHLRNNCLQAWVYLECSAFWPLFFFRVCVHMHTLWPVSSTYGDNQIHTSELSWEFDKGIWLNINFFKAQSQGSNGNT